MTAEDAPDGAGTRLPGLDLARALAIFAMVLVNFDVALSAEGGPPWLESATALFQGRASALFVILAGMGLTLLARANPARARGRILRRSLALCILGYAFSLLWPGDILHYYGFYFLLGCFCLRLSDHQLLALAIGSVLAFPLLIIGGLDYEAGWNWQTLHYAGFWTVAGQTRNLLFNGFHPLLPWGAFLLFGQWLGRRMTAEPRFNARLAGIAAALALSAEALSSLASTLPALGETGRLFFATASMPPMPLYMLAAGAEACLVIALSMRLVQFAATRRNAKRIITPLIHTGQLALTIYVAHVVFGILPPWILFESNGEPALDRGLVVLWWLLTCALCVFSAQRWRRRFGRGPLEAILRRVTG